MKQSREDKKIDKELFRLYRWLEESGFQKQEDNIKVRDEQMIKLRLKAYIDAFKWFCDTKAGSKDYRDSIDLMNACAIMLLYRDYKEI